MELLIVKSMFATSDPVSNTKAMPCLPLQLLYVKVYHFQTLIYLIISNTHSYKFFFNKNREKCSDMKRVSELGDVDLWLKTDPNIEK